MADLNLTPYLRLALDSDAVKNRNWALIDQRLLDLAARLVDQVIGPQMITQPMLAKPSVGTPELFDGSVTAAKLAPGTLLWGPGQPTFIQPVDPTVNVALALGKKLTFTLTPLTGPHPEIRSDTNGGLTISADLAAQAVMACGNAGASILVNAAQCQITHDLQVINGGILAGVWAELPVPLGAIQVLGGILQVMTAAGWQPLPGTGGGGGTVPSGPAGGDLAGTYPNPTVRYLNGQTNPPVNALPWIDATQSIVFLPPNASATRMYLGSNNSGQPFYSQINYNQLVGSPTTLPPSGLAGGDLAGTYPNPALGVVQAATVKLKDHGSFFSGPGGASVAVNDGTHDDVFVTTLPSWELLLTHQLGDSAAISRRAANAAAGAYVALLTVNPDGTIRVTTDPLNALDLTTKQYVDAHGGTGPPTGPAGGDLAGTYPNPTIRATMTLPPSGPAGGSLAGTYPNPTIAAGIIPTTLPPSGAAGGGLAGTYPNPTLNPAALLWSPSGALLTPLDTTKQVAVQGPTTTVDQAQLLLGTAAVVVKGRVAKLPGIDWIGLMENCWYDGTAWHQDDAAKYSGRWVVNGGNGSFESIAPGGVNSTPLAVSGVTGKTTCTLADISVQRSMLAVNSAWQTSGVALIPASLSLTTMNAWISITSFSMTTRGGVVLVWTTPGLNILCPSNNVAVRVYLLITRDGATVTNISWSYQNPGTTNLTLPISGLMAWDTPAAGAHTYLLQIFQSSASQTLIASGADNTGSFRGIELS